MRNAYILVEIRTGRDHMGEPGVDGRIILKWSLSKM
jgi:hypothetical protein